MAQQHTGVQVAAVHTGAGHDQIAHAGQAREGFRLAAHGQTQPGQLGIAAGDKGGLGVIAIAQAQCDADGQRNDVFDRAAQLGAAAVGVGVDAEAGRGEGFLHGLGGGFILAGGNN